MKPPAVLIALLVLGFFLMSCEEDVVHPSYHSPGPNPTAWVANSLGGTLTRIDLVTDSVTVNAVDIGLYPNDIVILGSTAYVVNSGDDQIQIVNLRTGQTEGTIELFNGQNPWAMAIGPDQRAYVTNWETGNVSVIDLVNRQETGVAAAGTSPEGICVYNNVLYVTDVNLLWPVYGQGYVYTYALPDLTPLVTIPVAKNPQVVALGPDGYIHVVCTGDFDEVTGQVQFINPYTMTVADSVLIGHYPGSLAFTPQGFAYLGASDLDGNGELLSYNAMNHQIIRGTMNPIGMSSGVWDVAVTRSGHLLVSCFGTDELVELNELGEIVKTYTVGDGPCAVAVWEP
jgi:YVTN family beta-propeller protein